MYMHSYMNVYIHICIHSYIYIDMLLTIRYTLVPILHSEFELIFP